MSRSVTTPTRRPRVSAPPTRSTTGTSPTSSSFITCAASDTGVSGDTERGFFDMISEIFIVVLVAEVRGAGPLIRVGEEHRAMRVPSAAATN